MSSPLTVAWTGDSHTAALILKGLLTSVGIPAQVAGEELTDEFAQAKPYERRPGANPGAQKPPGGGRGNPQGAREPGPPARVF